MSDSPKLTVQPLAFREAVQYVRQFHRHHRPPAFAVFQLAVNDGEKIVGVLIAGRPVARPLDNGTTIEVSRCCTDGTRNACSILYGSAWKAAKALGWSRMVTYTLPEEGGASLRGVGAVCIGEAGGGVWVRPGKIRTNDHPLGVKWRWEWNATPSKRIRIEAESDGQPDLFNTNGAVS